MAEGEQQSRRTVTFPAAPTRGPDDADDADAADDQVIVSIFGLPSRVSTEGPGARAVIARAMDQSRATGDPVEIDLDELEAAATADAALPRVLVTVGTLCIEDGTELPTVGDVVRYPLIFVEADDPDDELATEWSVQAEPLFGGEPRRNRALGGEADGTEYWTVLLRGPGWAATWNTPRPVEGSLQLHGRLITDLFGPHHHEARVMGRIQRLWLITETIDTSGGNTTDLSRVVPGSRRLRAVQTSPRWFDHGHGRPDERPPPAPPAPGTRFVFADPPPPPAPWVCETGVLAELDLLPNRPPPADR